LLAVKKRIFRKNLAGVQRFVWLGGAALECDGSGISGDARPVTDDVLDAGSPVVRKIDPAPCWEAPGRRTALRLRRKRKDKAVSLSRR